MTLLTMSAADGTLAPWMDVTDMVALDEALDQLQKLDQRLYQVIELHVFSGLSLQEVADELGVTLRTINREAKLYGVEYQIGQQEPYAGASTLGVADLPMRQSIMRVRLPLLHEGDLMDFFRMLAARRSGVFTMNACEIDRIGQGVSDGTQPTLNAECELTWITVPEEEAERNRP